MSEPKGKLAETAVIHGGSMNTGFGQPCRGYFLLKFLGYPEAMVLHDGYSAWAESGLPDESGLPWAPIKHTPFAAAAE